MNSSLAIFTAGEGNLLIRLVLAHLIADFALQTKGMVQGKRWTSRWMLVHIAIVFAATLLLSGFLWQISMAIALSHWAIDGAKKWIQSKAGDFVAFVSDQAAHLVVLIVAWAWQCGVLHKLAEAASFPFVHYRPSLILLAYVWLIFPVGYLVRYATKDIDATRPAGAAESDVRHGGTVIGQFERMIILTLVLYSQYDAIGFLITGKSIIRFADRDRKLRSEYVLVGTMMSYGIAILTGVIVNYMLSNK